MNKKVFWIGKLVFDVIGCLATLIIYYSTSKNAIDFSGAIIAIIVVTFFIINVFVDFVYQNKY